MYLIEDLRVILLNLKAVMIQIIHKVLVLIKNHRNHLYDNIFECFQKV